jgi:simple sugar transport system permease protein
MGVLAAASAGALIGALHALLTVLLGLSQHVAGLGITLLATSLASFAYRVSFPKVDSPPTIQPFAEMAWLPIPVLNAQTPLTLLALLLVPLIGYVLYRTPVGLAVRMVGENPAAAEGQGLSVARVRIGAIVAGSALMGVAGAFLTLAAFNAFYFNMVNGRGWVCVALVVFASWRPGKALLGAVLFALFDALQLRLQQSGSGLFGVAVPYQVYLMLPYLLSIVALVVMARRAAYPQALMKPYRKGER